jgi:hypothetical protein
MYVFLELWNDVFLQNLGKYSVVVKVWILKNVEEQDGSHEKML